MTFGDWVLLISVLLYLVAGVAFILQGRGAFGACWLAYAFANAALVYGSIRGGL